MGKKLNLIGQKFNKLLVLEETLERNCKGGIIWKCQCDCGNITTAAATDLKSGHKRSCGCLQKEAAKNQGLSNLIDLTNQKYGLLTVQNKSHSRKTQNGSTKVYWNCICDCGNTIVVEGNALKTGNTQSCDCIRSFGEQKVTHLLQQASIPFEKEKIFSDAPYYRFDFFVDNSYIIEYDGRQHFEDGWTPLKDTRKRDLEKDDYCKRHNIPLIRIPYTHYASLSISDLRLETSHFILQNQETEGGLESAT